MSDDALFQLQSEMLNSGKLTLPSPFGGELTSLSSVVLDYAPARRSLGSCIAYFFEEDPAIAIFATEEFWPIAWYDPISDVILEHKSLLGYHAMLKDLVIQLKLSCVLNFSLFNDYLDSSINGRRNPTLLLGSVDYISSHLFCDLSGLERLIAEGAAPTRLLVTAREVFGPVDELFSTLTGTPLWRPTSLCAAELNKRLFLDNAFAVRVTDRAVTPELAGRVAQLAQNHARHKTKDEVDTLSANAWPILFIALRTHNRRWLASHQELASMINDIQRKHPRMALIIDGHGATNEPVPQALLEAEQNFAAGLRKWLNPSTPVIEVAGRPLADSIYAATKSHCHLSAQGTTTTKPVLIANKPGVVVGSRTFLWDVRPFRVGIARCETPWQHAVDLDPDDIYTDYNLSPELVRDALLAIIDELECELHIVHIRPDDHATS